MRLTTLATTLLAFLAVHITLPETFTPIPVAHGSRECGWNQACLKNCRGDAHCERQCRITHC
jgi:hypothetical protein